jgi:TonB family protein
MVGGRRMGRLDKRRVVAAVFVAALLSSLTAGAAPPGITPPSPIGSIAVPYPAQAHGDAVVDLVLVLAEDGTVAQAEVKQGDAPFAEAARSAAENFRFEPATRNGIPVRARVALRVVFQEPAPPATAPSPDAPAQAVAQEPKSAPAARPRAAAAPAQVVVLGEQRTEIGSIHIPKEEARRVPGAFSDPFRVVEVLPGVASVLSGLPYYYVRGASPGSVGYLIDGIRVPLLFHVGPGPSVIAPGLVERVDLFPGSFPARFGRYSGAIFAGETSAPSERAHGEGQLRIFDASAMAEQPFASGRGSVALGGRYSFTQALLSAVAPDYKLGYYDYQARLSYAVTARDRLTAFGFGASDLLRNRARPTPLFDTGFNRLDLRWDHNFEHGRMRLALTGATDRVFSAPDDPDALGSAKKSTGLRLRWELEHDVLEGLLWRVGADVGAEHFTLDRAPLGRGVTDYPERTDLASGGYTDLIWRPARGTEIVPGVRLDLLRARGKSHVFVEPRLASRTLLTRGLAYLAGFGVAHQLPTATILMPGRRPDFLELSEQLTVQANQGLEYALPDGMLGRTTLFHQWVEVDTPGVHGRSYGAEQFLRRDFTHKLGGFISYTLSRAQGSVGREQPLSSFDRTHVLSVVLGYDFGSGYRAGARAYYASGRAISIACPTPDCGPGDAMAPRPFQRDLRLPGFFRLDARVEKRWTFKSGAFITGTLEWFNALISDEVDGVVYTPQGLVYQRQSALTLPSIGVEVGY